MFWSCLALAVILSCLGLSFLLRGRNKKPDYVDSIKRLPNGHPVVRALQDLIDRDGAGSWPPRSSYGMDWPAALRSYHAVYMELSPFLATETMAWEDSEAALTRMKSYRAHARKLLSEKVNMEEAKNCLNSDLSPEIYNGLFACIAISRHAYR